MTLSSLFWCQQCYSLGGMMTVEWEIPSHSQNFEIAMKGANGCTVEHIDRVYNQCKTCSPSIYRFHQDNIGSGGLFERWHSESNWLWWVRGGSCSMPLYSWDEQRKEEEEGEGEWWARISQDDKHSWLSHHLHLQDKLGNHFSEHIQLSFTSCSCCVPKERVWIHYRSTASPHFILFSLFTHKEIHLRTILSTSATISHKVKNHEQQPKHHWTLDNRKCLLLIPAQSLTGLSGSGFCSSTHLHLLDTKQHVLQGGVIQLSVWIKTPCHHGCVLQGISLQGIIQLLSTLYFSK